MLVGVVALFLTGLFYNLPEPILAAIVLVAVRGLFDVSALRRLYRVSRSEFAVAMVALFGVLLFGMLEGILIAVVVALLMLIALIHPSAWKGCSPKYACNIPQPYSPRGPR